MEEYSYHDDSSERESRSLLFNPPRQGHNGNRRSEQWETHSNQRLSRDVSYRRGAQGRRGDWRRGGRRNRGRQSIDQQEWDEDRDLYSGSQRDAGYSEYHSAETPSAVPVIRHPPLRTLNEEQMNCQPQRTHASPQQDGGIYPYNRIVSQRNDQIYPYTPQQIEAALKLLLSDAGDVRVITNQIMYVIKEWEREIEILRDEVKVLDGKDEHNRQQMVHKATNTVRRKPFNYGLPPAGISDFTQQEVNSIRVASEYVLAVLNVVLPMKVPPCRHSDSVIRLRQRKGNAYFVCASCGMKWREASESKQTRTAVDFIAGMLAQKLRTVVAAQDEPPSDPLFVQPGRLAQGTYGAQHGPRPVFSPHPLLPMPGYSGSRRPLLEQPMHSHHNGIPSFPNPSNARHGYAGRGRGRYRANT